MDPIKPSSRSNTIRWQIRLLPFMSKTIIILSCFFFLATFSQLIYLQWVLQNEKSLLLDDAFLNIKIDGKETHEELLKIGRFKILAKLESTSIHNEYHQARILLLARLWINYIGFITGMILVIVGTTFILGKLNESLSEVSAKVAGNDFSIKSASPGLILSFLGTVLIITTLVVNHPIETRQNPLYLHDDLPGTLTDTTAVAPALPPPRYTDSLNKKIN